MSHCLPYAITYLVFLYNLFYIGLSEVNYMLNISNENGKGFKGILYSGLARQVGWFFNPIVPAYWPPKASMG